jgi:hypothetical protein
MSRLIRSLQDSREIIEPFHTELVKCIEKGFFEYIKIREYVNEISSFVEFKPRTKACIIHDLIRANALEAFSDKKNLKIGEFNGVFGINIDNKLFVRFKKMNRNFDVSAFRTPQHKKYLDQHQIIGFPEKPTFLFAGYIPNHTWTNLNGIYLACWNGDFLEWYDEAGKYSYEQYSIEFEPNKQIAHDIIERRVKLKKGLEKNKETGTDNN